MTRIPKRVSDSFAKAIPRFQKVLQLAKDRDVNEADTVSILNDILGEVFGYDKYLEVTSEFAVRNTYCDLAVRVQDKVQFLLEAKAIGIELKDNHLKQIPNAIAGGKEDGMQTFNMSLADLIRKKLIKEDDAMLASDNPDELKMNLQGIYLTQGRGGILRK